MLMAGAGRSDITPPVGIAHAGWGAQTHQVSEGNDMPLYITALALSNGDTRVAIVDFDIGLLTSAQDSAIRGVISERTGIQQDNIRLSYSHTHSAPMTFGGWISEGMDLVDQWLLELPEAAADSVVQAIEAQVPAVSSFGVGECDININRRPADDAGVLFTGRNWDGFVDRSVEVVGLDDLDGNPVATLVNYACHPTIMGHLNKLVTPDFPGPMRRVVEQTVGGICLFLQGASGNQGPVDGFTGDLRVYRKAGAKLGAEASRVRLNMDPFERKERLVEILRSGADLGIYEDDPVSETDDTLTVSWVEVELPAKEMISLEEAQSEYARLEKELGAVRASGASNDEVQAAVSRVMRSNINLNIARMVELIRVGDIITLRMQAIRIGNTVLVTMPVEPFAELGALVKERSVADNTVFSGFSNGHYNYLPTTNAYEEGGYEVRVSFFAPGSADLAVDACLEAIEQVWTDE
ncbi:MAG: neutral/alkaline non-lysosomal ceramidase N-terminal domain-containing protein [Chloroflexi bacterium]|nr:neutral/alkaline non-lysosomal ceramidase N-terminal domain-containing protein [Chloroflexota bacterium]